MNSTTHLFSLMAVMFVFFSTTFSMHPKLSKMVAKKRAQRTSVYKAAPLTKQDVQTMLSVGDCYFAKTPGFSDLQNKVKKAFAEKNHNSLKGYYFELEKALDLKINRGHDIRAFHKRCVHPQHMYVREFDIITNLCAIECKDIGWAAIDSSIYLTEKLATQFAEQAALVKSGTVEAPYFMVCSKNPIPFHWQVWFMQRSILYMEGPA